VGADAQGPRGAPRVALADDLEGVRALFREYAAALGDHAAYLGAFDDEVAGLPAGYDFVLLAELGGCVAVRGLGEGVCEMKRLFVRLSARGTGTGRALALAAIGRARDRGYTVMRLDTLPTMAEAASLYTSLGFVEVERYNDNPAPGVRFMELRL
jgi:GNAT superfamily N-acetyltransferase